MRPKRKIPAQRRPTRHRRAPRWRTGRFWAQLSEYLAASLVLVTPFVIFITYHEYRLLSSEVLWCLLILAGIGLMASVVTLLGGMAARVLISAGLLTFYLEVQVDRLTDRMIAATCFGLLPVCWLLRRRVSEIIAGFSVATVALTLAFPESTEHTQMQWRRAHSFRVPRSLIRFWRHLSSRSSPGYFSVRRALAMPFPT